MAEPSPSIGEILTDTPVPTRAQVDLLWWTEQNMRTEKGKPYEFSDRAYLKEIYDCWTDRLVIKKAAQIGITSFAINKALWLAASHAVTIIFTMPTATDVRTFSQARMNPSLQHSRLQIPMSIDNVGIKQIGQSFLYLRGAWSEKQALSIPSDFNIHDELDRSKPDIREMYEERLSASEIGWRLDMSTPTFPNTGISSLYAETDQREWFVRCKACGREDILTLDNIMDDEFRCLGCRIVLDRTNGHWEATVKADVVGFHITQLMAPWITAARILQKQADYKFKADWHNFVLAEEYAGGEGLLTRADIITCLMSVQQVVGKTVVGVDWGDTTWALVRQRDKIVHMAKIEGDTRTHAGQVAEIMGKLNADAICDFGYGDTKNKELIEKLPGRVWMCVFKDGAMYPDFESKHAKEDRIINIDRTRSLQESMQEMKDKEIGIFPCDLMEDFITHHKNLTEELTEDKHGEIRTVIGRSGPDHLAHANNFARLLACEGGVISPDEIASAGDNRVFSTREDDSTDEGRGTDLKSEMDWMNT